MEKSRLICLSILSLILCMASCKEEKEISSVVYSTGFEDFPEAMLTDLNLSGSHWTAIDSTAEVANNNESVSGKFLHLLAGDNKSVSIQLGKNEQIRALHFNVRAVKQPGLKFRVEALLADQWVEIYKGDEEIVSKNRVIPIKINVNKEASKFKFTSSAQKMGVFLDDLVFYRSANATIKNVSAKRPILPVLKRKEINKLVEISINVDGEKNPLKVTSIDFDLEGTTEINDIEKLQLFYSNNEKHIEKEGLTGTLEKVEGSFSIPTDQTLQPGANYLWLTAGLSKDADLSNKIAANCIAVHLSNGETVEPDSGNLTPAQRIGVALLQKDENNVHTYRIPGLATTNKGTLIGVYDNRYFQGADLQGDIDVGMSRSTDGGETWEPMKPIIDMGEYGGKPRDENGIGDPSILVDRSNNTIWVAGVWAHGHPGKRNWHASKPGMSPEDTSQFILAKSEDDGLTWSEPINITAQIKEAEWQLLLQGPGKGITLKDGTLVFPAQFKDKDRMPHSTIIYSKDHGKTWKIGSGAKSDTTEAQVVELEDGSLMLNMRDNRNRNSTDGLHGRSIATTTDLGKSWIEHPTSRLALQESTCMASIISFDHPEKGQVLFFSNPNTIKGRTNMTIKTSFDQGMTWPIENQLEIYEDNGYGYSCMTVIDENHIGILYEGSAELYFEKINVNELF